MHCRGLVNNLSTSRRKITPGLRCCTCGFVINLKAANALGMRCRQVLANEVIAGFDVAFWQIVLQKSFCTGDQKFCGLQARLSCKDVRDLIASRKTHRRLR